MAFSQGHALIIGVGSYQVEPRLDIPISVSDANQVQSVLVNPRYCGYPQDQVSLLHDDTATRQGLLAALDDLAQRTGPGDTVVLFYCGHGDTGEDGEYY